LESVAREPLRERRARAHARTFVANQDDLRRIANRRYPSEELTHLTPTDSDHDSPLTHSCGGEIHGSIATLSRPSQAFSALPDDSDTIWPCDESRLHARSDDVARVARADGNGARGLQCRQAWAIGSMYGGVGLIRATSRAQQAPQHRKREKTAG